MSLGRNQLCLSRLCSLEASLTRLARSAASAVSATRLKMRGGAGWGFTTGWAIILKEQNGIVGRAREAKHHDEESGAWTKAKHRRCLFERSCCTSGTALSSSSSVPQAASQEWCWKPWGHCRGHLRGKGEHGLHEWGWGDRGKVCTVNVQPSAVTHPLGRGIR